jgi:starch phosphorylase
MMEKLESTILPLYYDDPAAWIKIAKNGMNDIHGYFTSSRMVMEYYEKLYNYGR